MRKINCNELDFVDQESAIKFVERNEIEVFSDDGDIDIALCYRSTKEQIKSNWKDISLQTALYFQSNLKDEVIGRNMILVYMSQGDLDINVKKEIQSNTYCCRKIVRCNVDETESEINELMLNNINGIYKEKHYNLKELIRINHPEVFSLIGEK
ncbi:ABC-three component system middle component 1 [Vibrio sp. 10N.239.311.G01]|uniref:ABC-three component system middle component 1 n=1 Tax=Vibrio sp. 10N.239.311.G01 TaxID=3229976 RepID=UPI00354BF439